MVRAQHVRSPRAVAKAFVSGASLALFLVACQGPDEYFRGGEVDMGQAGSAGPGAAGNGMSGAAGSNVSGAAGSNMSGAAGSFISGAGGSTPGAGGSAVTGTGGSSTGSGGATGAGGRAGTTGTGGTAVGRGGTTGTGGSAAGRGGTTGTGGGAGGRAGTGGTVGRGGTSGTIGTGTGGGRGGGTGRGGATGAGGTSGGTCPTGGRLDCTTTGVLKLTTDGTVVDFSAGQWSATTARWCDGRGLGGTLFSFAGRGSTAAAAVDTTAQNLKLNLMVTAGQYAGGGVYFDECVDAGSFNSIQFSASVTAGSLTGCTWQVQLQTQDQRPNMLTNPSGGTCTGTATTTTCSRYPAASMTTNPTATATTFTARFTSFNNPANSAIATPSQIVGLQWQVNSSNGSGTCTVELRIDNVKFVTM
jgi:hypothetical protein